MVRHPRKTALLVATSFSGGVASRQRVVFSTLMVSTNLPAVNGLAGVDDQELYSPAQEPLLIKSQEHSTLLVT